MVHFHYKRCFPNLLRSNNINCEFFCLKNFIVCDCDFGDMFCELDAPVAELFSSGIIQSCSTNRSLSDSNSKVQY
jgi:hypothetical protein